MTTNSTTWYWYDYINPLNLFTASEEVPLLGRNAPTQDLAKLKAYVSPDELKNVKKSLSISKTDILNVKNNLKKTPPVQKKIYDTGSSYSDGSPLRELHNIFPEPLQ